jgi:hypothetical protein
MADPVHGFIQFLYVGAALIANPPIVGGHTLGPVPDANGMIAYAFTQPAQPCDGAKCEQEFFRLDLNPQSCWSYNDVSLENVEEAHGFVILPNLTSETLRVYTVGNAAGHLFVFRAHVSPRCALTS